MPRINLRISESQFLTWENAASAKHVPLSSFVKMSVESALRAPGRERVLAEMLICLDEMKSCFTYAATGEFEP